MFDEKEAIIDELDQMRASSRNLTAIDAKRAIERTSHFHNDPEVLNLLGDVLFLAQTSSISAYIPKEGAIDAEHCYLVAIRIAPWDHEAYESLASYYYTCKDMYEQAIEYANQAIERGAGKYSFAITARCSIELGSLDSAKKQIEMWESMLGSSQLLIEVQAELVEAEQDLRA